MVLSVEASFFYPSVPRFLAEMARVLRPESMSFIAISADATVSPSGKRSWPTPPMRLMSETVIAEQVARGLEKSLPRLKELNSSAGGYFVDKWWTKICTTAIANRSDLLPDVLLRQRIRLLSVAVTAVGVRGLRRPRAGFDVGRAAVAASGEYAVGVAVGPRVGRAAAICAGA